MALDPRPSLVAFALLALLAAPLAHGHRLLLATCGPATGYEQSKVVNVLQDCRQTGPNYACPGCYLYRTYSLPNKAAGPFFVTSAADRLVLPTAPCRGVEEWVRTSCGKERIWQYAWGLLTTGAQKKATGFGINPTHRRSQHQMHVHVGKIWPSLSGVLDQMKNQPVNKWRNIKCESTTGKQANKNCVLGPGNLQAMLIKADDPSKMNPGPFELVYSDKPDNASGFPNAAAQSTAMMLHSIAAGYFVVVKSRAMQTECFFSNTASHCT